MIFKIEDHKRSIFLDVKGFPPAATAKIIQDLHTLYQAATSEEPEQQAQQKPPVVPGIITAASFTPDGTNLEIHIEGKPELMPDDLRSAGGLSDVVSYEPEDDLEAARQTMKDEIDKEIARLDEVKKAKQQAANEDEDVGELMTEDEKALAAEYKAMAAAIDKAVRERKDEKAEREQETAAAVEAPPELQQADPDDFEEDMAEILKKLHEAGASQGFDYRVTDDGKRLLLKCYYICPACGTKSKRYVFKDQRTTSCHECKKRMTIRPSIKDEPFPTVDRFNNIYVAGEFLRAGETMEDLEKELKRI